MNRYRVIYDYMSTGGHHDFSAEDDAAAWAQAERDAYGARIVTLSRVELGIIDKLESLVRPAGREG